MNDRVDVVVVGAGPVGLLTAIELALGGARTLVLERLAAPSTTIKAWARPSWPRSSAASLR